VEARVLAHVLHEIRRQYGLSPFELPPAEAAAWYDARGCRSAGMSPEETREWIQHRHHFRSSHARLIQGWIAGLETAGPGRRPITLQLEDAPSFLTVINDHRLLMAARHDIGEEQMGLGLLRSFKTLSAERQRGLFEIELLAHLMELVLAVIPGSGSDGRPEGE
jgi:hypothetical protein